MEPPRHDLWTLALVDVQQRSGAPAYPKVPRSTSKLLQTLAFIFSHKQTHWVACSREKIGNMQDIKNIAILGKCTEGVFAVSFSFTSWFWSNLLRRMIA